MNPNPSSSKTKDGPRYRVSFEVDRETWDWFQESEVSNQIIACDAYVVPDAPEECHSQAAPAKGPFGEFAKKLHQSGFFRSPAVWRALGTDEDYQAWCRHQKCPGKPFRPHSEGVIYHHVLRAAAMPAREGKNPNKPAYHGIPLCHSCHDLVHRAGETALWQIEDRYGAKAYSDRVMIQHLERWAHEVLCKTLEVNSLTQVAPDELRDWCALHALLEYFPG